MKPTILIAVAIAGLIAFPHIIRADWPRETIGVPSLAEQIADIVVRGQKVASAKQAANAEIEQARRRFFADCVNGIRGSDAEKGFADLLFAKDIYFLSLYTHEGTLNDELERAAVELAEARNLSGDDRYSSIARFLTTSIEASGVPRIQALYEATLFAGLRKAGMTGLNTLISLRKQTTG
jgi:hypothetical protein